MAVVSSGEIKLNGDVNIEINGSLGTDVSLNALSTGVGFSEPHGLFEFYGYVDAVAPSVSTGGSSSITTSSMTISGNVTSDGGGTITERGFYFGTNSSNATSNTKYTVSGTTGSYSRSMTGLSAGTTYYWWAYATNSVGTTIGSRNQAATSVPTIPYTMVGYYNYTSVPSSTGPFSCGFQANQYPDWYPSNGLKLSATNTLGTTVTVTGFISGGYGFSDANGNWSGGSSTGVTKSGRYIYISNGYNIANGGGQSYRSNTASSTTSTQIVNCPFTGYTYANTSASGYASRNTLIAVQPFA